MTNDLKESNFVTGVVYLSEDIEQSIEFVSEITTFFQNHFVNFELIGVNDNVIPDTKIFLSKLHDQGIKNTFTLLNMGFTQGLELAMNAGDDLAIGDFVFEFDSCYKDYSDELIMEVYLKVLSGFDIVAAGTKTNRLTSKIFYMLFNKSSRLPTEIGTESFRIISRRAINRIEALNKVIPYRKAIYANSGLSSTTLYYQSSQNEGYAISHHESSDMRTSTALNAIVLFTDFFFKFSFGLSLLMIILTLVGTVYTLTIFFAGKPIPGYTTTMLLSTSSFFAIFIILAIVIKYLSIIVSVLVKKQKYIIKNIEKI